MVGSRSDSCLALGADVQQQSSFTPKFAFVEMNMRCKYDCSHCYQNTAGLDRDRKLSLEESLLRIESLYALGVKCVIPVSGEILLDPSYLAAYKKAGWQEYLLTSGVPVLKDPSLADQIKTAGFKGVRISAHYFSAGMPNLDRISPAKDKSIKKIVSVMTGAGLYVDALCILHKSNYLKINEICLRAREDGIRALFFMNLFSNTEGVQANCLDLTQIQETFELIAQAKQAVSGIEIDCLGNFGPTSWKPSHLRLAAMKKYCPAGVDSVYIAVDGSVYPNHCMLREELKMGVFEDGQFVLDTNPLAGFDRSDCAVVCGHLD